MICCLAKQIISCACSILCFIGLVYLLYYSIASFSSSEAASETLAAAVARRVGRQAARAAATNVLAELGEDDDEHV